MAIRCISSCSRIYPVKTGETTSGLPINPTTGLSVGAPPQSLAYWVGSSTFSGPPIAAQNLPAWVQNVQNTQARLLTSTSANPVDYAYTFELQLPIDPSGTKGIPLPTTASFGMYLNVITMNDAANTNSQASWPLSADPVGVELTPPPSSEWGVGSFTGLCGGISIVSNSITDTIQDGSTGLTLQEGDGTSNTFNVQVQNTTRDANTGALVFAPQIQPTFFIYNLGDVDPTTVAEGAD